MATIRHLHGTWSIYFTASTIGVVTSILTLCALVDSENYSISSVSHRLVLANCAMKRVTWKDAKRAFDICIRPVYPNSVSMVSHI